MKQLTTAQSVNLIVRICEHLNAQIQIAGSIKPNNKNIWNGVLHELQNEHWRGMLETLNTLCEQQPHIGKLKYRIAIDDAYHTLMRYQHCYDRVLDQRNKKINHKGIAWKALMTMREIYCECCDIDLPNSDHSRITNTFKEIMV